MATNYAGNLDTDTLINVYNENKLTNIVNKEPKYF